jgi:hypothetical protein
VHPANTPHLESANAARKPQIPHGSHAFSAWQKTPAKQPERLAKIRRPMSFSVAGAAHLDVGFATLPKTDISSPAADPGLGNVLLSC